MKLSHALASVIVGIACLSSLGWSQPQMISGPMARNVAASTFFVDIKGDKTGEFKNEITAKGPAKGGILGLKFSFQMNKPVDPATGLPSGKRQYAPITITKEWGPASPQIFMAFTNNEVLSTVTLEFVKANMQGQELVYQTIILTNANISSLRRYMDVATANEPADPRPLEDVTFTFQKIELRDASAGGASAMDNWSTTR